MPYIGRPLNAGNLAVQSGTGDGSDTTPIATLDYSVGSSNSIGVYLDGVRQLAGTDFTASGTTLTFTTAPANGVGIDVYFLGLELSIPTPADATVAKAKITTTLIHEHVDTTITAADSILFSDSTGSNANKKDTVQGILDLVPAGGAWNLIGTQVASSSASLTQTGLDSTYDTYAIMLSDMHPETDNVTARMRFGDSSGIDSGASDYSSFYQLISSGSYSGSGNASEAYMYLNYQTGNAAGEGFGAVIFLHRPGDGSTQPMISGTQLSINGSTGQTGGAIMGKRNAVITLDRIEFLFSSGAIVSGRMSVYGVAHA
jgi:hypothetical protein